MMRANERNAMWGRPVSRRSMLRAAGGVGVAAAVAPLLAACARSGNADPFAGGPAGLVNFANWPLYIDRIHQGGGRELPSMMRFTQETGIDVNYREVIPDAEVFYQRIQPELASGRPTGWDIMVITNGLTLTKLIELGQVMQLPDDERPNFAANADPAIRDPSYDPGNRYSMAWQSGITGIAYNPALTGGHEVSSLEELFSGNIGGPVGLFGDSVDLPNLSMIAAGFVPEQSTPAEWRETAAFIQKKLDAGIIKGFYVQNYVHVLENGDVAASMAWSGDIFQINALGRAEGMQFRTPKEGGLLWTDNMMIPAGAEHPVDAMRLMDFVYDPQIAAMITEWVNYVTPVPAARDVILQDAANATDPTTKQTLTAVANSPLVFLPEADRARLHTYRELKGDEELAAWNDAFSRFFA